MLLITAPIHAKPIVACQSFDNCLHVFQIALNKFNNLYNFDKDQKRPQFKWG